MSPLGKELDDHYLENKQKCSCGIAWYAIKYLKNKEIVLFHRWIEIQEYINVVT